MDGVRRHARAYRVWAQQPVCPHACLSRDLDPTLKAAGRHFNRGQRAFFFALGYLGWFVSPWVLFVTTALVVIVTWRRQFASDAWRAMGG
jgi:uncharacterized membrane protein